MDLESSHFAFGEIRQDWKTHFSRCVENQLDYAHLPFVHKTTIGANTDPSKEVQFELKEDYLKVITNKDEKIENYFELRLPNIWRLQITRKFYQVVFFVPIDETHTRLYVRSYLDILPFKMGNKILAFASSQFNYPILNQDKRVVLEQEPKDTREAHEEQLVKSDRAVQAFRQWLQKG